MAASEQPARAARRPSSARLLSVQIGYQLRVLVRSPLGSFATLVVPLTVLLAVNLLYKGTRLQSRGDIPYTQFFTPAMIAFAVVNACYMSVISQITLARDEGILKRIRSTPLPSWIYMAGRLGAASLVAIISAIVVVAVGAYVYDFEVIWSAVPAVLVTLALGMFCFCALALAVSVLIPRADSALPVAWGTILPLCFISDVFVPIEGAPHWLGEVASFFPLRGFADALETAFNPVKGSHALQIGHLEQLAVWGVAASAFALIAFRWEPSGAHDARGGRPPRAVFAVDRARALFVERRSGVRAPKPEGRSSYRPRDRAAGSQTTGSKRRAPMPAGTRERDDPLPDIERIEGPAPAEDARVPPDPA
jgi:ABC-2 type transport system permease protein